MGRTGSYSSGGARLFGDGPRRSEEWSKTNKSDKRKSLQQKKPLPLKLKRTTWVRKKRERTRRAGQGDLRGNRCEGSEFGTPVNKGILPSGTILHPATAAATAEATVSCTAHQASFGN